jgi:ADP-ribose diphosphatase
MNIWEGKRFAVVQEDGYEIAVTPAAVAIVAVAPDGRIALVRQRRPAVGDFVLELPAGLIHEGEVPLDTAKRELREETGLRGGTWRGLGWFWSSPGFTNERVWLFEATGLEDGDPEPDPGEELELVLWTVEEVEARLDEIVDATTLIGLLLYLREH